MKIVLTGGGSGGHFYPIIAVAEEIRKIAREEHLVDPELIYMATEPYDTEALFEHDIQFTQISAGKWRRYFSIRNFFDVFKIGWGLIRAFLKVFWIFPDVIFSKGGYPSIPVLVAGRFFGIPIIIHESDSRPGRANAWASHFAKRIAISYPEAAEYFKSSKAKLALTGNPVRTDIQTPIIEGADEYLQLEKDIPVIVVMGGSQGAQVINDALIETLPELVEQYIIIHQTGKANFDLTKETANLVLQNSQHPDRYKPFGFLNVLALRMVAGAADLIISRAGSGAIFEIALWQKPSILIPIPQEVSHDQHTNAFSYARAGGCLVIEQENLTPHILISEIDRLMSDPSERARMIEGAKGFAQPEAARKIAKEILELALEHEN